MLDEDKAKARTAALRRQGALDSAAAVGLEKTARLAQFIAGCRFAEVNLLDGEYQHTIARAGALAPSKIAVEDSMCIQVVEAERALYLPDATEAAQFAGNPNTSGPDPIRFYSAVPLRSEAGVTIGTLCVYDNQRIELNDERLALLEDLADHVREHLELHSQVVRLGHSATHDSLTGLANRALLSDRLAHAMTRRSRHPGELALALVDLDDFKSVNDRLGHQAGDELLVQVAQRLRMAVREEDTVARFGGDEFVILYEQLPEDGIDDILRALHQRLCVALDEPLIIRGCTVAVAASVGFARADPDELGYELLGRADLMMYEQKAKRKATPI